MLIMPSLFPMFRCPCFYSTNQMDMAIIQPLCYVPQGEKFCPVDMEKNAVVFLKLHNSQGSSVIKNVINVFDPRMWPSFSQAHAQKSQKN